MGEPSARPPGYIWAIAKHLRADVPRTSHADFTPAKGRDPKQILDAQEETRVQELLPLRHERMAESAFGFFRGAAAVMAFDLSTTPATGLQVQACGDAHLSNFGVFATPERRLVFDLNDFDETLPAPFEWDVKRLAASFVLAAREAQLGERVAEDSARRAATAYRERVRAYAGMRHLEVWYATLDVEAALPQMKAAQRKRAERGILRQARRKTNIGALDKLTEVADGKRRIVDNPPLIEHLDVPDLDARVRAGMDRYVETVSEEQRTLLQRYRFVDWARKVVGVGSVGTECHMLLLLGDREDDPLFLQIKEADQSVLAPYAGASDYEHEGERVVRGQRLTQAASDIFLGWVDLQGRPACVRQLRDMKGSVNLEGIVAEDLLGYADTCGLALARAHARTGDPAAIGAYLGKADTFDVAISAFAVAYADQSERDHAAFAAAVGSAPSAQSS